jgi:hypothetical protein
MASPKSQPLRQPRRLRVESLEPRLALTLFPTPVVITGTNGDDVIVVSAVEGSYLDVTYEVNGVSSGIVRPEGPIQIFGLAGNDEIIVSGLVQLPTIIDGGPGADVLQGGAGDDLFLLRDNELDTVNGYLGIDTAATDSLDLVTDIEHLNPLEETATNRTQHVKVLVINFDPRVPSQGNRRLYEIFNWANPRNLVAGYEADLERASGGAIEFEIVEWRDIDEIPAFTDGSRYTPDQYYQNRLTNSNWNFSAIADYPRIVEEQNIVPLIDSGAVDEVWFFGDHFFHLPGESWMAGPGSFFINGPTYPQINTQRPFTNMGFSYERGVAEMLHNTGHRTESTLNRVYGGWNLANPTSNWDRFSANFDQSNGVAGVGTTHWPPNAQGDYDTFNPRVVQSWADDFLNYPNLTGATQPVSRETWGKGPNPDYERNYQNWYFAHLPRAAGVNPDGKQNNWWKYIYDFQNYSPSGQPLPASANAQAKDLYNLGETTFQFRVAYSSPVAINLATIDDDDLIVRGPNGFQASARLVSTSDDWDDVYIVGTYEITAPGGIWDEADFGSYTIELQAGQVRDILGSPVSSTIVGSFNVLDVGDVGAVGLPNDEDTLLLVRLDGNASGVAGQTPTYSDGLTYVEGRVGQAALTSSTGRMVYEQAGNILGAAGTVEFWIRPEWNPDGTTHQFFQAGHDFQNGMLLSIDGANNLRFIQWGDDPNTPATEWYVERGLGASGANWQAGEWHHIAATWDSAQGIMAFYVDGQLVGTSSTVTIPAFAETTMSFGARRDGPLPALAAFDEIRISSRARTASEIQADYAAGIGFFSGLTIEQRPDELRTGRTVSFKATATDVFGGTYDVTEQVRWSTSDALVGLIDSSGNLRGVSPGNVTVSAQLGSLTADLPVMVQAAQGPVASLHPVSDIVTFQSVSETTIQVTYEDPDGVAINSLGFGDVRVRNEAGYSRFATLLSVSGGTNGSPRTATNRLPVPGGQWDPSDNGEYVIELIDHRVFDTTGIPADNQDLGRFTVAIPEFVPPSFQVTGFETTPTGVTIEFGQPIVVANLNLFDMANGSLGPADIQLVGQNTGVVRGSVVADPSLQRLTLVSTAGTLAADTYTLTLRSAEDGFIALTGEPLDGDADGIVGGDFVHTFTVSPPAPGSITVGLPSFSRGPGQEVNVPADGAGLPVSYSDGGGIVSASFELRYDPALLTISGATVAPGLNGATVNIDTSTSGVATIQFTSATPLPAGTTRFIDLQATVPVSAPYRSKALLDVTNVVLNGGAVPAMDDDAVQVVALVGDASGNGTYSGFDASHVARIAVAIESGLEAFPLLDATIIADITGANGISGTDTSLVLQTAAGLQLAEVPRYLPGISLVQGGPDPKLSIPTDLVASAGDSLLIPVHLDSIVDLTGDGVSAAELAIYYDATVLDVTSVQLGSLLTDAGGWMIASRIDSLAGRVLVSVSSPIPLEGIFEGELVKLLATVKSTATPGALALNLAASARDPNVQTQLNEGRLTLIPAPTDRPDDVGVDGLLTIVAPPVTEPVEEPIVAVQDDQLWIFGTAGRDEVVVGALGAELIRVRANGRILGEFSRAYEIVLKNFEVDDHVVVAPELFAESAADDVEDLALLELLAEQDRSNKRSGKAGWRAPGADSQ